MNMGDSTFLQRCDDYSRLLRHDALSTGKE